MNPLSPQTTVHRSPARKPFWILSLLLLPLLLTLLAFSFYGFAINEGYEASSNATQMLNTVTATEKPFDVGSVWFNHLNSVEACDDEAASVGKWVDPTALFDLLPHLSLNKVRDLNARVLLKAKQLIRSPPELLLVIPSMYRKEHNYLNDTLRNIFANIFEGERHLVQIVVVVSENPWDENYETLLMSTVDEIERNFGDEVRQGLIEVIAPPKEWFPPNLENIRPTLGDSPERMRWRAKQSLDYAYAMYHTRRERPEARFYVQLEDDVITVPGFLSELHRFANAHSEFFVCEFSNLGFIGRMFHNGKDLAQMAHFVLLLYRSLPVDWILAKVINAKFCSLDETIKQCMKKRVDEIVLFRRKPPLFQHIGRHSSLPGKMQNLTESRFNRNKAIEPLQNENPPFSGVRSELVSVAQWHNFYEKYAPVHLDRTQLEKDNEDDVDGLKLVEFDYGQHPLQEIKGLRVFFVVQFSVNLSSVSLPNSLLRVRFEHSVLNGNASNTISVFSSFPRPNSATLQNYFLLTVEPRLQNVRSIQISLSGGDWRKAIDRFTLTAVRILT
uniref:Alpha-1,3-mannosyl-glycoprotein 4-beta-N-acetylglucosaminyltransferase A n=1 Tax=Globodera pallida TaxID=36090 RepID=A0A183C2C0_GLOPA